jgi:hypothetical protein
MTKRSLDELSGAEFFELWSRLEAIVGGGPVVDVTPSIEPEEGVRGPTGSS